MLTVQILKKGFHRGSLRGEVASSLDVVEDGENDSCLRYNT